MNVVAYVIMQLSILATSFAPSTILSWSTLSRILIKIIQGSHKEHRMSLLEIVVSILHNKINKMHCITQTNISQTNKTILMRSLKRNKWWNQKEE